MEPYLYSCLSDFMVWRRNTSHFTRNCTSVKYLLTYSTQNSPSSESNWFSASQEIRLILRNPKVHYHIHKCLPNVTILSQLNLIHNFTYHLLNIHSNIFLPSMSGSPKWSLSLRFLTKILYTPLPHVCYMPHPSNSSHFYHPNNIG